MAYSFTEAYPNITRWIEERGWIEVGADEHSTSLVRCLDEGGMVWESPDSQNSLDEALQSLYTKNLTSSRICVISCQEMLCQVS